MALNVTWDLHRIRFPDLPRLPGFPRVVSPGPYSDASRSLANDALASGDDYCIPGISNFAVRLDRESWSMVIGTACPGSSRKLVDRAIARTCGGFVRASVISDHDGLRCKLDPWTRDLVGTGRWSPLEESGSPLISAHNAVMLDARYCWSATFFRSTRHTGIRIATDAIGIRAMLSDRESYGRRRSPLLHWVSEHSRKRRDDSGETDAVRRHLRGQRRCAWNGYLVEIRETEFDREQQVTPK